MERIEEIEPEVADTAADRISADVPEVPSMLKDEESDDSDDLFSPKNPPKLEQKSARTAFDDLFGDDDSDDDIFNNLLKK